MWLGSQMVLVESFTRAPIIHPENAYAELANLLSLVALDIFTTEKYQQFINQRTDFR